MNNQKPTLVEICILLYCLWNASDIFSSWSNTPSAHVGWVAFLIWISPLIYLFLKKNLGFSSKGMPSSILFGVALVVSTIGFLGSLRALEHLALAISLSALFPWTWKVLVWMFLAISWMPALGWFSTTSFYDYIAWVRIILALSGAILMMLHYQSPQKDVKDAKY